MGKNQKSMGIAFNRFAAIDFETADYGRDSACSISIVIVEKRKIVKKTSFLIRPPRRDFIFSYLHGITWRDVAKKPGFDKLWPKINKSLHKVDFIAAHNASFDRGVLHACCAMAGIVPPDVKYLCTMKLARYLWGLYPTRLPDVCRYFNISLKHHHADSDAIACAKIALRALEEGIPANAFLGKNVPHTRGDEPRGAEEEKDYEILTGEISKAAFGVTPSEYKNLKGLKRENLVAPHAGAWIETPPSFCAAEKTDNSEGKLLFKALGKIEAEHAAIWRKILKLSGIPKGNETCYTVNTENLKESHARETRAIEFYKNSAKEAKNSRIKQIFNALVEIETDHLHLSSSASFSASSILFT